MANPLLNDKSFGKAAGTGTLPPPADPNRPGALYTGPIADQATQAGWAAPASSAPTYPGAGVKPMTVNGTIWATLVLFGLLLVAAVFGWNAVDVGTDSAGEQILVSFPSWTLLAILVGFGVVLLASFKPHLARFLAPVYAIAEGVFVGAISRAFEIEYAGIILAAVGATLAVFLVMLVLYVARVIKVTERFRSVVIGATLGSRSSTSCPSCCSLFGVNVPVHQRQPARSASCSACASAGLAALNLLLDFDIIERGAKARGTDVHGVVRRVRPARHHRVALPRDAPAPRQAASELSPNTSDFPLGTGRPLRSPRFVFPGGSGGRSRLRRQGCDHHGRRRWPRPPARPARWPARRTGGRERPRRRGRRQGGDTRARPQKVVDEIKAPAARPSPTPTRWPRPRAARRSCKTARRRLRPGRHRHQQRRHPARQVVPQHGRPSCSNPVLDVHLKGAFYVTQPAWVRHARAGLRPRLSTPRRPRASSATSARPTTAPRRWASSASPACSPSRAPSTTSRPTPSPRSPSPA